MPRVMSDWRGNLKASWQRWSSIKSAAGGAYRSSIYGGPFLRVSLRKPSTEAALPLMLSLPCRYLIILTELQNSGLTS